METRGRFSAVSQRTHVTWLPICFSLYKTPSAKETALLNAEEVMFLRVDIVIFLNKPTPL